MIQIALQVKGQKMEINPNIQEISSEEYQSYLKLTKRPHKYHAEKVKMDGYTFDSKAEAVRYNELLILQNIGIIHHMRIHPRYELLEKFKYDGKTVRGISYEADFEYCEDGQMIVEDVKGIATEAFKIKEKLFKSKYPHYNFRRIV